MSTYYKIQKGKLELSWCPYSNDVGWMLRFAEIKCFLIMARLCLVCLALSRSSTLAMLCPEAHPRIGHIRKYTRRVTTE